MDETQWETTITAPAAMLRHVRGELSVRKKTLLGCALCRLVWCNIPSHVQPVVQLTELHMDRNLEGGHALPSIDTPSLFRELHHALAQSEETSPAHSAVRAVQALICSAPIDDALQLVMDWVSATAEREVSRTLPRVDGEPELVSLSLRHRRARHHRQVCYLIREIVGNPFHQHMVVPTWLPQQSASLPTWIISVSETARSIAEAIQETGDFHLMPILADAVEEAGCSDVRLLRHLRDPEAKHVRGCWALDLILGLK